MTAKELTAWLAAYGTSEGVTKSWLKRKRAQQNPSAPESTPLDPASEIAYTQRWEQMVRTANVVANELGFDVGKLSVLNEEGFNFQVADQNYKAAGCFNTETGQITLFAKTIGDANLVNGLMAHEVMHYKFDFVRTAFRQQYDQWIEDSRAVGSPATGKTYNDDPMDRAGYLKPEFADKYPLLKLLGRFGVGQPATDPSEYDWRRFSKDDGVTEYSKSYWRQHKESQRTDDYMRAVNETLAEIAYLRRIHVPQKNSVTGRTLTYTPGGKAFRDYYAALDKGYKLIHSGKEGPRKLTAAAVSGTPVSAAQYPGGLVEFHYPNGSVVFGRKS